MRVSIYVENKSLPSCSAITPDLECVPHTKVETLPSAVFDEIELIDVLEYDDRDNILSIVLSKLRHNGMLKIQGTDAMQVVKVLNHGGMDLESASAGMLNGRMRLTSVHKLRESLERFGMETIFTTVSGIRYLIEAKRP